MGFSEKAFAGTLPIFNSRKDAEITLEIYRRNPVLIRDADGAAGKKGFQDQRWRRSGGRGLRRRCTGTEERGDKTDGGDA